MQLLHEVAKILRSKYNNLRHERDWELLFDHLLKKSGWWGETRGKEGERIVEEVFGGEIVNATTMLLQGLSPVRVGFLDGQARMTALHYYLRQVQPSVVGTLAPLWEPTRREEKDQWTIARTGREAVCTVHTVESEGSVTYADVHRFRESSKKCMDILMSTYESLSSITPYNLSDCIMKMINTTLKVKKAPNVALPTHVHGLYKFVLKEMWTYDKRLSSKLFEKVVKAGGEHKEKAEDAVEDLFRKIYKFGSTKVFPSLNNQYKGASAELLVLMLILGAGLADTTNMLYLRNCIQKEWLVPIVESRQVRGIEIESLHPGTFVNPTMKSTWYYSKLHLVGNQLEKAEGNVAVSNELLFCAGIDSK